MSGVEKWLAKLKQAEKTSLIQDGKRKIHYKFDDKTEMAEDYNMQTGELLVRKWRTKNTLGALMPWDFEVGQKDIVEGKVADAIDLQESSSNPIFNRFDTQTAFQWRIRNLPYPLDNYIIDLDSETGRNIVIKTKNKKYYKKFNIPDMERTGLKIDKQQLHFTHSNNTLIITYTKPNEILAMEKMIQVELKKLKSTNDGDVECKQS